MGSIAHGVPCVFLVASHCTPDHGVGFCFAGLVTSNPIPDMVKGVPVTLVTCPWVVTRAPLCNCVWKVGPQRQACSGLYREGQNRGIWRCGTCGVNSPRAQAGDEVPVSPVGTQVTPVAGAHRRLSWTEIVSQGRWESADGVAVSSRVIRAEEFSTSTAFSFVVVVGESLNGAPSGMEPLARSPQPTWATPLFTSDTTTHAPR